jgi:hypothetical protein
MIKYEPNRQRRCMSTELKAETGQDQNSNPVPKFLIFFSEKKTPQFPLHYCSIVHRKEKEFISLKNQSRASVCNSALRRREAAQEPGAELPPPDKKTKRPWSDKPAATARRNHRRASTRRPERDRERDRRTTAKGTYFPRLKGGEGKQQLFDQHKNHRKK